MQPVSACIGFRNWDMKLLRATERTLVEQGIDDIRVCNQNDAPQMPYGDAELGLVPPLYEVHVPTPDWRYALAHNVSALAAAHSILLHTNCGFAFSPGLVDMALAALQPGKNFVSPTTRYWRCSEAATKQFIEDSDLARLQDGSALLKGQTWQGDFLLIHKFDFARVGGYDSAFRGWGRADRDFTARAIATGLQQVVVDGDIYHLWDGFPAGRQNDAGYKFNDQLIEDRRRTNWWRNGVRNVGVSP